MNGAVGAFRQSFAQYLLRAGRTDGDDDYFAAILFFLAQGFFQRIGVGLIHFIRDVFANPGARLIQLERGILLRDLLDANQDFHER